MILEDIKQKIEKANSIVLLTHEMPDGDAVGSTIAMYIALKRLGKNVDMIIENCPRTYDFLPFRNEIKEEGSREKYDLTIALDCSDIKRLNGFSNYFETAKDRIVIDHHGSNTMFGDINFVNPVSPACCQILVLVLEYLGVEIDKEIGTCILAGIITDTGGFKYDTVTAETFELVAQLLNKGINVSNVYKKVLQIISRSSFELRKIAMNRLEFLEEGKISFTYITKKDEETWNAVTGEHEGIVEMARDIEGVEVAVFLRETENGYKASLRSNNYVNVSDICLMLGGGGHPKAAGANLLLRLEQAKEKIVDQIKKYI